MNTQTIVIDNWLEAKSRAGQIKYRNRISKIRGVLQSIWKR